MNIEMKKQLSLGVIISYLVIIMKLLSGIIYLPIILHSLGPSEYGVYSLCTSFSGYLSIFNGGMNVAYIRYYVQAKEKRNIRLEKINGIFGLIFCVLGLIGCICGIVVGIYAEYIFGSKILPNEYKILKKSMYILSITTFFLSINGMFSSAILAHEKFVVGKFIELMNVTIVPFVTIPLLLKGDRSLIILQINLIAAIFTFIFDFFYVKDRLGLKFKFGVINEKFFKSIVSFSGFITIQVVMDQLNWQIDKYLLANFKGAEEVSVYTIGSTFNNYYIIIASVVSEMFIAEINRLVASEKNEQISKLFVKTSRIFAIVAFFLMSGYIIFGKQFICMWAGEEYMDSFYVGLFLMLPVTVTLSQGLGQNIVRAKNLHKIQIIINTIICILNLAISIPLAKCYGAIGSAFGTFVCEIFIFIIIQSIYYQYVVKINMKAYYKEMFYLTPGWVIPILFGVIISYFKMIDKSYGSVFLFGAIYFLIYFLSIWKISLSISEKNMIKNLIRNWYNSNI